MSQPRGRARGAEQVFVGASNLQETVFRVPASAGSTWSQVLPAEAGIAERRLTKL